MAVMAPALVIDIWLSVLLTARPASAQHPYSWTPAWSRWTSVPFTIVAMPPTLVDWQLCWQQDFNGPESLLLDLLSIFTTRLASAAHPCYIRNPGLWILQPGLSRTFLRARIRTRVSTKTNKEIYTYSLHQDYKEEGRLFS